MEHESRDRVSIDETSIGNTPMIEVDVGASVEATILAKVEWFNLYDVPYGGGSIKSRIAKRMLDVAERDGELEDTKTIIEPTSGNTGSEIARIGVARGYQVEIVMPDNASEGKIRAVEDAGAKVHFVDANLGYDAVIERCEELIETDPDRYYRPNQYENPNNPGAHQHTTAAEIWEQTGGAVTHFVAGVGTGGTITGTGRGLSERGDVEIIGFEPGEVLHAIDGLKYLKTGDHYHPGTYDESILDRKEYVETAAAYQQARKLRQRYLDDTVTIFDPGQFDRTLVREHLTVDNQFVVGTSSGAAVQAVHQLSNASVIESDDLVVIIFADRGDKYANIPLWESYLN